MIVAFIRDEDIAGCIHRRTLGATQPADGYGSLDAARRNLNHLVVGSDEDISRRI
jgi:hypothetical protein